MKVHPVFVALPMFLFVTVPLLHGDRKVRESEVLGEDLELHELDRRQADDMAKAWSDLVTQRTKDHFIKAFIRGDLSPQGYELIRLTVHGTLLNLTFQNLEDDDETRAMTIRAREVLRLEVLKRPW